MWITSVLCDNQYTSWTEPNRIAFVKQEQLANIFSFIMSNNLLTKGKLLTVAEIVRCAQARKESRGLNYNMIIRNY